MELSKKIEIYEWASRQMFSILHPNKGFTPNPFGQYGIDSAVYMGGKLFSVEEWKFNNDSYQRLDAMDKDYLIEKKKYDELIMRSRTINTKRKSPVFAVYRRFFSDAELVLPVNLITTDLSKYYKSEVCEINQFTSKKEHQKGYYIPLYAVDDNGDQMWIVNKYNSFQKKMYQMVLEERNKRLEE
jgi:hypothetical protein